MDRYATVRIAVNKPNTADNTMTTIAIIADDLTGALDAAAPLQRQGLRAAVALAPQHVAAVSDADIIALTTESRHVADPGPLLATAVAALANDWLVYKKIDSTLRGPIAAELRALLELTGRRNALVTPTLPHQARALVDGWLTLDGTPTDVHLPTLLRSSGLPVIALPLAVVRDPAAMRRALQEATASVALIAVDAITDDDLRTIAEAVATLDPPPLLAGSAGLAAWLPRIGGLQATVQQSAAVAAVPGPLLFAFGSAHQRTHEQLERLRDEGITSVVIAPDADITGAVAACVDALNIGNDVVLSVAPPARAIAAVPYAEQHRVAQMLAQTVAAILDRASAAALVLGGGDTAYAVCERLGIPSLALAGEVLPGLPLSHGTTSAGRTLWCVTKAGGFGTPDALRHVRAALHGVR